MVDKKSGEWRPRPLLLRIISWVLSGLALFFLAAAGWIHYRFGNVSLEQIVTNLPGEAGGEGGSEGLVTEAIFICVGLPLVCLLLTATILRIRYVSVSTHSEPGAEPKSDAPINNRQLLRLVRAIPAVAFVLTLALVLSVAGVPKYVLMQLDNRSFAEYYVSPKVLSTPEHPKNLITIYLESVENTFSNETLFGQNLIAELDEATAGWANYDDLQQYWGGGWTMAGFVGTQCGIPLKSKLLLAGANPNDVGEKVDSYLPGAMCLGNILAENGYTNAFVGGAQTHFAGKDTFLKDHGYTSINGLLTWEAKGEERSDISIWGLSDLRMFEHAKDTVVELREAGSPFNLTILTLDTHEPAGIYPSCNTGDTVPMANAIKCSMKAVAGFLNFLHQEGFDKDSVIVVMGDHLKVTSEGGDYKNELDNTPTRTIVFRVSSPDQVSIYRRPADQLSVLPTMLDLLGFGLPDGRAGLGVSFVGDYDLTGTALALGDDEYHWLLDTPSTDLYREFWKAEI